MSLNVYLCTVGDFKDIKGRRVFFSLSIIIFLRIMVLQFL